MAPYDANEVRRSCLEGTRVNFLQRIYKRIAVVCEQGENAPEGGIVLWINGMGGTGKTTVIAALLSSLLEGSRSTGFVVTQSNVGLKNIAEKLVRVGLTDWKLLVAADYMKGW